MRAEQNLERRRRWGWRAVSVLMVVGLALGGCALVPDFVVERSRHSKLQSAAERYGDSLRWGRVDEAAIYAAEHIRFKPARRDRQPVDHTTNLRIVFQLV